MNELPPAAKRTRTATPIGVKLEALKWGRDHPLASQGDIAKKFGVTQSQISKWARSEEQSSKAHRSGTAGENANAKGKGKQKDVQLRDRAPRFPELVQCCLTFLQKAQQRGLSVTDELLRKRADTFLSLLGIPPGVAKLSHGWMDRMKGRIGVHRIVLHGEAGSVDVSSVERARLDLKAITTPYDLVDIYNADETALFFRY